MSGEKNLEPSQKKFEDAREKGQVAASKDAKALFNMIMFYLFFFWGIKSYSVKFSELIDTIVSTGFTEKWSFSPSVFESAFEVFLVITMPLIFVCAVATTLMTWAQIGFIVAPEAAMPSFKKFDAVENLKNMFSKKSLMQLLMSIVKAGILGLVGYKVFMNNLNDIVYSYRAGLAQLFLVMDHVLERIIFISLGVFVALAVFDWFLERSHLVKSLKMSHQDVKDEQKQSYGNPEIKKRMKSEHRNILNSSLNRVSTAKAVVANPTHISVALDYEPGVHDLPYIVSMGIDQDALMIRREAKKHGIPVIVNVKLARMLYNDCEEDEYIQKEHLELAAQVFRAVMQLTEENNELKRDDTE